MRSSVPAWSSRTASWLAALAAPPAFVALGGGADLDLPFARVVWYDTFGPLLALATALAIAVAPPRSPGAGPDFRRAARLADVASALAIVCLVAAVWAALSGGFQTEWLSVRHALRPAALAALLWAVAVASARGVEGFRGLRAALALLVGAAAAAAALHADRAELRERIAAASAAPARARDVLFIVVDTLRADAVGFAVEGEASATPNMDALATGSVVFEAAFAQAPWTLPSMMSLVTSRYASTLHPTWRGAWPERVPLDPEPPVLAQALRDAGYHSAGFVKNPMLARGTGFERGYDVYEWVGGDDADAHSARQLVDASLVWAQEFARARRAGTTRAPFFLSLHFMDPHAHYRPPRDFVSQEARRYQGEFDGHTSTLKRMTRGTRFPAASDIAQMRRLYRDEVRYADAQLGRLLEELAELGLVGPETAIVLTADHGEQFGEHGSFEHRDIYVENVHVPLVLRLPGVPEQRTAQPIGLIDLAPTLLDALGLPPLAGAEGRSRMPNLLSASAGSAPVITEFGSALRVTDAAFSLLRDERGGLEFYDRRRDTRELEDLAADAGAEFARLAAALDAHAAAIPVGSRSMTPPLGARERATLEALGYLDDPEDAEFLEPEPDQGGRLAR